MQFVPHELEIGSKEGFTARNDIFGRKTFGDQLTRIVCALQSPCVLLLDAPWGTGKTTFVKMWQGALTDQNIPSVYFDSFANDYQEDAFLAVASQIIAEAQSLTPKHRQAVDKFKSKAVKAAKVIGLASFRLGVRALTAGLIEGEALEKTAAEVAKGVGEETTKVIDDALKGRLESHEADRKTFDGFRSALAELAAALSEVMKTEAQDNGVDERKSIRPLVFIIDELDRCRPNFALEILERIKHFFSVPNVVFLLVSSRTQLEAAVKLAYGNIDAHTYLEKFYHVRVLFPAGRSNRPDRAVETYLNYLGCDKDVAYIIEQFSCAQTLSLRTLERIVTCVKISRASIQQGAAWIPQIVGTLCILKVVYPDVYDKVRKYEVTINEIASALQFSKWRSQNNNERTSQSMRVEKLWSYALGTLKDQNDNDNFYQMMAPYNLEPSNILPYFCEITDGFALPSSS